MEITSASTATAALNGSRKPFDVRDANLLAHMFNNEAVYGFEDKRDAWFAFKDMVAQAKKSGQWAKLTDEQREFLTKSVDGSKFAANIEAAQELYAKRFGDGGRNPHVTALEVVDGFNDAQKKFFEIGLQQQTKGMTLEKWQGRESALGDVLDVWRLAEADADLIGQKRTDMLKALQSMYDAVGSGSMSPDNLAWPDGVDRYLKILDQMKAARESKDPQDVVTLSKEAITRLTADAVKADAAG